MVNFYIILKFLSAIQSLHSHLDPHFSRPRYNRAPVVSIGRRGRRAGRRDHGPSARKSGPRRPTPLPSLEEMDGRAGQIS